MSLAAATSITPTNATDAQFRAWGSAISTKLAAMGLVQTGDTGQINWTTVLAPLAASTVQGYEVWRFADTLQATVPVFFKFEYGSGSGTNNPSIHISVGNGSNGAGALTGVLATRQQVTIAATATPITAYWSGDTNRFVFCFQGASTSATWLISMERSTDASGVVTSEAVLIVLVFGTNQLQRAWNCVTGPYTVYETSLGCLGSQAAPFGTSGTQVAVYPVFHNKGVFLQYGQNLFGYVDATISANAALSFAVYGATRTYMPIGTNAINTILMRTANASSLMMRFD